MKAFWTRVALMLLWVGFSEKYPISFVGMMVLTFSFAVIQMSYLNTFDISGKWMFASKYPVLIAYISIWKIVDVVMFAFNYFESMVA